MADVYFEAAFGQAHPIRDDGSGSTDYISQDFSVGLRLPTGLAEGAILGEIGFNYTIGNEDTYGSHRYLPLLRIGYRQPVATYLFASVKVGTGYNMSRMNFGDASTPLPEDTNAPLLLSGEAGGQYCFGRHPCVEAFFSPFYETNLIGNPDYRNTGLLFGLGVSFDLGRTVPYKEYAVAVGRQAELQGALAASEERARSLQRQQEAIRPPPEQHAANEPPPPQPSACPSCPVCPSPPPPPRVVAILAENPLGVPIVFTNESPQLARREEREHRVRVGLSDPWLDRVAVYLKSHPNIGVRIKGYANDTGPEDQNITLSNERAQAVARYLRRHGVPERQIVEVRGFGSSRPPVESIPADTMNRVVLFEEVALP